VNRTRLAALVGGIVLAVGGIAGPALATTAPVPGADPSTYAAPGDPECATQWATALLDKTVADFRAVGDCEVDRRLATIVTLRGVISTASQKAMTGAHAAALTAILDGSESTLHALRTAIDGDTTLLAIRADIHSVFADVRLYALVARQVHLVRGDDAVAAAVKRLNDVAAKIQAAITQAQSEGKDVTAASADLAAMQAAIADAASQVAGDADAVLPLTPAEWNAGTAKPILDAAHDSLKAARGDIKTAIAQAKAAIAALKAA
jgi:hypothetical protein